ncbi:VOC family protein [Embleya sp. NBC_00896]|uniref:VOC family protein n=1 Tax=Embleya sp. NBC_00896 TaxID=2975961 RepID=UPI002F9133A3|nr:VOC family protein [Embleya sp. NBC_00896]
MSVKLNHTIVLSRDRRISAEFMAGILGLEVGEPSGVFLPVSTANGVTLDFATVEPETISAQHYAFLVSEEEFDAIFARLSDAGVRHYADPGLRVPDEINRQDGGRGAYFLDPSGHYLEILTRPYGSGDQYPQA